MRERGERRKKKGEMREDGIEGVYSIIYMQGSREERGIEQEYQ